MVDLTLSLAPSVFIWFEGYKLSFNKGSDLGPRSSPLDRSDWKSAKSNFANFGAHRFEKYSSARAAGIKRWIFYPRKRKVLENFIKVRDTATRQ